MRRLSLAACLAVPLLLAGSGTLLANPPGAANFGCAGHCLKMFPFIHQHGPLFNYGPYYGYYPFCPYGPWDAYLRYDPNFYGDPGAIEGDIYGLNPKLRPAANAVNNLLHPNFHLNSRSHSLSHLLHPGNWPGTWSWPGHGGGCSSCSFLHASWVHGGWYRGHKWLDGHGCKDPCQAAPDCCASGGVAVASQPVAHRDPSTKYSGVGSPSQSAVFYPATPTLDPRVELTPRAGRTK